MAKIERSQKLFLKALKEKFQGQDVQSEKPRSTRLAASASRRENLTS